MNCTVENPSCRYDNATGKLRKVVESLAGFDFRKEVILTGLMNGRDEKFLKYINEQNGDKSLLNVKTITAKNLNKINANKLKKHLNSYYLGSYRTIRNSTVKKGFGNTEGFITYEDKQTAIMHNANLLVREYASELEKPRNMRRHRMSIINSVNQKMLHTYFQNYVDDFARKIIDNENKEYGESAIEAAKEYMSHRDKIRELENDIRADKKEIDSLNVEEEREKLHNEIKKWETLRKKKRLEYFKAKKESADEKLLKKLFSEHSSLKKEVLKRIEQREDLNNRAKELAEKIFNNARQRENEQLKLFITARNLTSEHSTNADYQMQNYGNLVEQALCNANLWYFQVINSSMMSGIVKEYGNFSSDEMEAELEETEGHDIIMQYADEKVDEMAKGWENHIYSNSEQTISVRMKMAIAMLPNLTAPLNSATEPSYDRNNGLGVVTYCDPKTVLNQIHVGKNITNVQEFIKALENQTQTVPNMYGLGTLVQQMKQDPLFANEVFINFAKPIVHKLRVEVRGNNTEGTEVVVRYSNPDSFPNTELFFRLRSDVMFNGRKTYNIQHSNTMKAFERRILNKYFNKDSFNEQDKKSIVSIVTQYFPTISSNSVMDVLNKGTKDDIHHLISYTRALIDTVGRLKRDIQAEQQKVYERNKEAQNLYDEQMRLWSMGHAYFDENGEVVLDENGNSIKPKKPEKEEVDYSKFKFPKPADAAIAHLVDIFNKYGQSKIKLDSQNADGSSSSNIMKNSWITRFFDRLENGQQGVQAFLEEITQGAIDAGSENQYSHNPLFFGIQDENGNTILPGMFTKIENADGKVSYVINADLCYDALKYSLLDGTRNNLTSDGKSYSKMSKNDFFLTSYFAFLNSISEQTKKISHTQGGEYKKVLDGGGFNHWEMETAVYGTRIGSDAPKTFLVRAPRYTNSQCVHAISNHILDEVTMFAKGLSKVFLKENDFAATKDIGSLYRNAFYDEKTGKLVKDGRMTGRIFQFLRLCDTESQIGNPDADQRQASQRIEEMLNLYGNEDSLFSISKNGEVSLNQNRLDAIMNGTDAYFSYNEERGEFTIKTNNGIRQQLHTIVDEWSKNYIADVEKNEENGKIALLKKMGKYNDNTDINNFRNYLLNTANMYMNYDDMFEGDYKFYKNSRDFLKRSKEIQAGGDGYTGYDVNSVDYAVHDLEDVQPIQIGTTQLSVRNGFKALTVNSVVLGAQYADKIQETLYKTMSKTMSEERARKLSAKIAEGHRPAIVVNDAQSYITLEEFIRRRYADGTLRKYMPLLEKLVDPNVGIEDIDMNAIQEFIQVQKNFYYDKIYDKDSGLFVPRQIKNAEFVLIPKLLPESSPLRRVYDFMKKNGIDQLNTTETTKAGSNNVFELFDENGDLREGFDAVDENGNSTSGFSQDMVSDFYYRNLYKQQDVKQHMQDEAGKVAHPFLKKIIDNCAGHPELENIANEFQRAYTKNIEESAEFFLNNMGWELDENGDIVNSEGNYATTDSSGSPLAPDDIERNKRTLNYSRFLERCREQAVMLGLDSNTIDYFAINDFGQPKMPLWNNNVAAKMQQVVNSLANKAMTQTLSGFHCVQVTDVGYDKTLNFDPETGIIEVRLPRTSKLLPQTHNEEEEKRLIAKMEQEGIDLLMGYRIPTEGKQSIARIKVVGFVNDALGSTIVVPAAWVRQTGSDFDIDTIYGISWNLQKGVDENGNRVIRKVPYRDQNADGTEKNPVNNRTLYRKYVEARIRSKIDRVDYGQEREDKIKTILDKYENAVSNNSELSEQYKRINSIRRELYRLLPAPMKRSIIELHGDRRRTEMESNTKTNMSDFFDRVMYPMMDNWLNDEKRQNDLNKIVAIPDELSNQILELSGKEYKEMPMRDVIGLYKEFGMAIGDILAQVEDVSEEKKKSEISQALKNLKSEISKRNFQALEEAAKEAGLASFEEFERMDLIDRLDRKGRENYMFDMAMQIMANESSREEQYSRSNFDNVQNGIELVNALMKKDPLAQTPYDAMSQIDYFDDTQSGAELKGRSVACDNTNSNNNRVRAYLPNVGGVMVIIDTDQEYSPNDARYSDEEGADNRIYDRDGILQSYSHDVFGIITENDVNARSKDNTYPSPKAGSLLIRLTQMGFSNDNRNLVGELVTSYSAQTTAHTLDAVKVGSAPNVTLYTFNVYKLLSSVGMPHEFAMKFMAQPVIQLLCQIQANNQSVFNKDSADPIKGALAELFDRYGIVEVDKYGNEHTFTANASWRQFHQTLAKYKHLVSMFKEMFGFDIVEYTGEQFEKVTNISGFTMMMYEPALDARLELVRDKNGELSGILTEDQAFCHDLAVLMTFKNLYDLAEKINKISLTTQIEKRGNAPQIFFNRQTVDKVIELLTDPTMVCDDGTPYMERLLPFKNRENIKEQQEVTSYRELANQIDVWSSAIQSYASKFKNVVVNSIIENRSLIATESDQFYYALLQFQQQSGILLTQATQKQLIDFCVRDIYNNIPLLLSPIHVDSNGNIVEFSNEEMERYNEKNRFWNNERSRIFGFNMRTVGNIDIKDVNNPTPEEIAQFEQLSPAQKVVFIQTHFDDSGVFANLQVTDSESYKLNRYGFYRQFINVNENATGVENMLYQFGQAFTSHNPLVKLAAIDLIKYNYVADGNMFRTGALARIIPNAAIYTHRNEGGMGIVEQMEADMKDFYATSNRESRINSLDFMLRFIKSHPNVARTFTLKKLPKRVFDADTEMWATPANKRNETTEFLKCVNPVDKMLFINLYDCDGNYHLANLARHLNLASINGPKFINIVHEEYIPNSDKTRNVKTLYYVHRILDVDEDNKYTTCYVALVPLNELNPDEAYDVSYNESKNRFNNFTYYIPIITEIERKVLPMCYECIKSTLTSGLQNDAIRHISADIVFTDENMPIIGADANDVLAVGDKFGVRSDKYKGMSLAEKMEKADNLITGVENKEEIDAFLKAHPDKKDSIYLFNEKTGTWVDLDGKEIKNVSIGENSYIGRLGSNNNNSIIATENLFRNAVNEFYGETVMRELNLNDYREMSPEDLFAIMKRSSKPIGKPSSLYETTLDPSKSENVINDLSNSVNSRIAAVGKKLINDYRLHLERTRGELCTEFIFYQPEVLGNIFEKEKIYDQSIEIAPGTYKNITIRRIDMSKGSVALEIADYIKNGEFREGSNRSIYWTQVAEQLKAQGTTEVLAIRRADVYKIMEAPQDVAKRQNLQQTINFDDETMNADTETISTSPREEKGKTDRDKQAEIDAALSDPFRKVITNPIDRISCSILNEIGFQSYKGSTIGQRYENILHRRGLDRFATEEDVKENKAFIYKQAARYYAVAASNLISRLNHFEIDGSVYSLDDPELYTQLALHDEYFGEIAGLILDSITFGNRIEDIMGLDLAVENEELKDSIQKIRDSILKMRNNDKVKKGLRLLIDIYMKKFSTNPLIINDILEVGEQFGSIDWFSKYIMNITDVENQEVQIVLKKIFNIINKARVFDAHENMKEYEDRIAAIEAMNSESCDMSKIVDSRTGRIRQDYNDKYLVERDKLKDDYESKRRVWEDDYTNIDKTRDYLEARYKFDKFINDHENQKLKKDYYDRDLKLRRDVMDKAGDVYIKYTQLIHELYNSDMQDETDDEFTQRRKRIRSEIAALKSTYLRTADDRLVEKDSEDAKKAHELSMFIQKRNELSQEYFDNTEYDGFWEQYNEYKRYLDWYDKENPHHTLSMKMQDTRYREAYNWIQNNGSMQFDDETRKKMFEAYRILKNEESRVGKIAAAEIQLSNARDLSGIVDGRKLSDDAIDRIRKEEESNLAKMFDDEEERVLYGFQPQNDTIYNKEDKEGEGKEISYDEERNKLVTQINDIMMRAVDVTTNQFNMRLFFGMDNTGKPLKNPPITNEDRIRLIQLITDLRNTKTEEKRRKYELKRYNKWEQERKSGKTTSEFVPTTKVNYEIWNQHKAFATTELGLFDSNSNRARSIQAEQFKKIFMEIDPRTHVYIPNVLFYNYYNNEERTINKEKTEALRWLKSNVQTIKTQYYYDAIQEHQNKGDFEEWFRKNHIYNPYTHRYEPLSIWTTIAPTGDNEFSYIPSLENMEKTAKTDKLNENYNRNRINYRTGSDSKYNSDVHLNSKETAMRDYMRNTLEKYATTERGKKFVGRGYMPRERKAIHDMKWYGTQLANMVGLSYHSSGESDTFKQIIDYSHDRESDFDMLDLIKAQGSQDYEHYPPRGRMSAEQYGNEIRKIKERNREIEQHNLEIDKAHRRDDWQEIMKDYVYNATIFNAKQATKPYFYLLLEDLEQNPAYKMKGFWNTKLVPAAQQGYVMEDQHDIRQLVQNFARRIIRDEHHEPSKYRTMANFLQNLASAKFMVFNLYGGINNVTIGLTGIAMEEFAGEYFDWNHFREAQAQYFRHVTSYLSTAFTEKSPDLTTALIKQFRIVDIDEMLQFGAGSEDLDTRLKNIRDSLYSLQSMGEHYMQNTGFLAMCKSNRLYQDSRGIYRIGDFKDFSQNLSNNAMEDVLSEIDPHLLRYYKEVYLKKTVKHDLELKKDITIGRKDINRNFLDLLKNSSDTKFSSIYNEVRKKYHERMVELGKTARETFNNEDHPTVESLFEYKNGRAEIKQQYIDMFKNLSPENKVAGDIKSLLADFRQKAIEVNHKIHGVYDKEQAAMMEKTWFGSLLMQYKKHLPWGIMKRWRRRGYYSEFRGGMERGVYQQWIDFMGREFIDYNKMVENKQQSGTNLALAHIQTVMECVVNMIHNWNFNKQDLAPWEVNNMNRIWGDMVGALIPMAIALVMHGLWDDDDIKDDPFLSSLMYIIDRQYSEATMYTPFGLVSEAKQGWSSPVAGASGPNDLWYLIENLPQYIADSDFRKYKTGQYAGRDKMAVMIRRNIPGVRPFDRIRFITKYNKYYKVGESQIGLNAAVKLGDKLREY